MSPDPVVRTMPGSLVLSSTALGVFGFVLTAIAVVQQIVLTVPTGVHTAIVLTVTFIGALGATSADAGRLGKLIPHGVAMGIVTALNIVQAVLQLSDIGRTLHAVFAGLIVLAASVGLNPTSPITPVPPDQRPYVP